MAHKLPLVVLALGAAPLAAQSALAYRGLEPGVSFADFALAASRLMAGDSLTCRTSPRTAALMECGTTITEAAGRLTLSAFVISGQIALLSVTDSGGPDLVARWRDSLTGSWGPGTETNRAMIQWADGGRVARLTWRTAGEMRWIALTVAHDETLARIENFVGAARRDP